MADCLECDQTVDYLQFANTTLACTHWYIDEQQNCTRDER